MITKSLYQSYRREIGNFAVNNQYFGGAVINATLDESGWLPVDTLLHGMRSKNLSIDREGLVRIVHENDKQRFSLNDDHTKIRANLGHSLPVDVELTEAIPPGILYHGTVAKFLEEIRAHGLKPMSRQYVHLSVDIETANAVGRRRGKPVVLAIDTSRMTDDGISFYLSKNGVWLTNIVLPAYITIEQQ